MNNELCPTVLILNVSNKLRYFCIKHSSTWAAMTKTRRLRVRLASYMNMVKLFRDQMG